MATKFKVTLPWINNGEETDLGSIPVAGEKRLERIRAEGAAVMALDTQAFMTHLQSNLLVCKDLIAESGVEEARRQWNIMFGSYENLNWPEDGFEDSLEATIRDYVYKPLGVETEEEAVPIIKERTKQNKQALQEYKGQRKDFLHELHLEEVFWLMWRAKPRPDWMPSFEKVPKEEDIAATKEYISYFLDDDDYGDIVRALRGKNPLKADLEAVALKATEEAVAKKANSTSELSNKQ